jgi:hypothetical protein
MRRRVPLALAAALLGLLASAAAPAPEPAPKPAAPDGMLLLAVVLQPEPGRSLDDINAHLEKTGFRKSFPPDGVELVSWHVLMGLGQLVLLRLPPDKLRAVSYVLEKGASGAYRAEFYPAYDLRAAWERARKGR